MRPARSYGGIAADERMRGRREQLIEAAIEVMARDGAGALTVRRVATEAGLSTRFVYESFADLDDLTGAAFDMTSRELATAVNTAVRGAPTGRRARITAVVEAITDFFLTRPAKGKFLSTRAYGHPGSARTRLARSEDYVAAFAALLADLVDGLGAEDRAVALTSRFLVSAFGETMTALAYGETPYTRDEFVHDNVELFLGALDGLDRIADQSSSSDSS
ncbi:TetR family transcriptional regulator [Nocardia uniformis]|uniref:TetR family transcriptional regulator n=1 Tax=Nocardia uniformis TaxID=53432 RepID=A0A849BWQ4_9NOCA|nr:TetR/AcrR family transcriptional regulator [Nocardia uniformis]NNH70684.1 TetR family transcriptional regulator [Nocardia uniformis]